MSRKKTKQQKKFLRVSPQCSLPGCEQMAYMVLDKSKPSVIVKEQRGKIWEDEDGRMTRDGELTSLVCYQSVPSAEGLCYYHTKLQENYINANYPLKGKVSYMGEGGLSLCSIVEQSNNDKS